MVIDLDLPSGIEETIASGETHTPLSYSGSRSQLRLVGHEKLYLFISGSHPRFERSHTDLHGGMASFWNCGVQIGANIAHRKNNKSELQFCFSSSPYGSIARRAFSCVLWCRWLGMRVMLYGIPAHIGMAIGSHMSIPLLRLGIAPIVTDDKTLRTNSQMTACGARDRFEHKQ